MPSWWIYYHLVTQSPILAPSNEVRSQAVGPSLMASWHLSIQSEVADSQLVQVEGFLLSWVDTSAEEAGLLGLIQSGMTQLWGRQQNQVVGLKAVLLE